MTRLEAIRQRVERAYMYGPGAGEELLRYGRADFPLLLAIVEAAQKVDGYSSFDFSAPDEFWGDLDVLRAALAPLLAEDA